MDDFRSKYEPYMRPQESSYQERFDIKDAKRLIDNLSMGIYPDAQDYLTGDGEDQRGLSLATLKKYNVGLGSENFTNDEGVYQSYDSVFFPIYQPKQGNSSRLDSMRNMKKTKELKWLAEVEAKIDTELAELIKMKVRAAYKPHKSKQRVKPQSSKLR